mgnify:FL=1|jgi:hypothetical protein|tara:strand:- start:19922 stop:20221 length:300 start_codon:yes stop_codon:yes gene_type:complete
MVKYNSTSPYAETVQRSGYLDLYSPRTFPQSKDDLQYKIDVFYENRPDLLAHDLYGSAKLWWVFAVRNPDVLKDPIYDFTAGTIIRIPRQDDISTGLGI